MKKTFAVNIEEKIFYEFLQRYNAPETGSMSSRIAAAIKNSLAEPTGTEDKTPDQVPISNSGMQEFPVLQEFQKLYEHRKKLGLSQAENLNEFLQEVLQHLRFDPLFETN